MTLEITTQYLYAKTEIGKAIAGGFLNLSNPGADILKATKLIDKARSYAFGSTAKFFRLQLRAAFKDNPFGWKPNREHPDWLGIGQSVNIAALIKANRPKKVGGRGYSRKGIIKPPRAQSIGGRLPRLMFHQLDEKAGTLFVGLIPGKIKRGAGFIEVFKRFQDGGKVTPPGQRGSQASMQRYLAAIGIPKGRNDWVRPPRPLIEPMIKKYPPFKIFEDRFEKRLAR
jgi:hypothetical protein